MNRRMILYMVGTVIKLEAALMLLPAVVCLFYKESNVLYFAYSIIIAHASGFAMTVIAKPGNKVINAREGFVIVALAWIALSAVGALPFYLSGEIPSYIDAFFETVSGFTTTGASILTNVEALSKGMLFWRSFTHWVGGMGVLVFMMAIVPSLSDRSIHILRAEVPGPVVGKLVPRITQTTRILYIIYIVMTVIEVVLLLLGGMSVFDSVVHAFGTAGTGGFGIKADSIASYSPYLQWVITVFMFLFGVNFNLYYLILIKKFRSVLKSTELWFYCAIVLISTLTISVNIRSMYPSIGETIRHAAFQVSSIITTTGYATTDFDTWPLFSKSVILLLMFIGACAGSTGGGIKVSRIVLLVKSIRRELKRLLHPRSVGVVRFEGKKVDDSTVNSVSSYLAIYTCFFCVIFLVVSIFESYNLETVISSVASCFNNIGPAFAQAGPTLSYSGFTAVSKIVLSVAMLLGRLEIYPIILTLSPSMWAKK